MLLCFLFLVSSASCARPTERIILATTTSVEDSGLLDTLAAAFSAAHPHYVLAPVAAGTGMVLEIGRRRDADVLLSHDSIAEEKLVADGFGYARIPIMYNDFVIAGPASDPAGARGRDAVAALRAIEQQEAAFVSRADDSGTHRRELALWALSGLHPAGPWYIEAGVGMGDALLLAGQKQAYVLADRGTFLKFRERIDLQVLVAGDARLLNNYGVIVIKGARNEAGGRAFAEWLVGAEARRIIASFGHDAFGRSLFSVSETDS